MKNVSVADVRNVAFAGHNSCGKTTILDSILYLTKVSDRFGRASEGTSFADYSKEEKERKLTIYTKPFHCTWENKSFFLIDNPGYMDFVGEVYSSLRVSDSAIIVVDGHSGIEVGTSRAWNICDQYNIPRMFFVNKMDKEDVDFFKVVDQLKSAFGDKCIPFQIPVGEGPGFSSVINILAEDAEKNIPETHKQKFAELKQKLTELVAETDDDLIAKYLETGTLSHAEILKVMDDAVNKMNVIPVLCGSAEKTIGIQELLRIINRYMPSPEMRGAVQGQGEQKRNPSLSEPFSAYVYKTISDVYVGQMNFIKIVSGKITPGSHVLNSNRGENEKIGDLLMFRGKEKPQTTEEAGPGDIIAVTKLKNTFFGDTLCDPAHKIVFDSVIFPKPNTFLAIEPKEKGDEEKISTGLHKIAEEDRTITMERNKETKEFVIGGLGDVHLEVVVSKMKDRFKVDVESRLPRVAYKETITKKAEGHERYKKQSGGRGQYGETYLRIEPTQRGAGFEFLDEIVGGVIPKNFIPGIEKGVLGAMEEGVIAGYPVVDLKVAVYDGSYHDVDSSEMAFKIAGSKAFKDAMSKARPILIEPIMDVTITVPADSMGDITGDLNSKRGRILGMLPKGSYLEIKAQAPIAEMYKFPRDLRSLTGGKGAFEMSFNHYETVPQKVADEIVKQRKQKTEEKEE